jgi:hypothetical protein
MGPSPFHCPVQARANTNIIVSLLYVSRVDDSPVVLSIADVPSPPSLRATARDSSTTQSETDAMLKFVDEIVGTEPTKEPSPKKRHGTRDRHTPERRDHSRGRGRETSNDRPPTDRHARDSREKEARRSEGRTHYR